MATAILGAAGIALARTSLTQTTTASPKSPDKLAIATANARQLLLLMDTDKNGKISKKEWMDFMSREFDRLDTDKSGQLDPHELLQSRVEMPRVPPAVQGK
jgi:Ca2+-binding EF-hand superfamily protein